MNTNLSYKRSLLMATRYGTYTFDAELDCDWMTVDVDITTSRMMVNMIMYLINTL